MKTLRFLTQVIAILLFVTCADEEVTPRSYPRIMTLAVSNITKDGAYFSAEITFANQEITEHGFLWAAEKDPLPNGSEWINLGPATGTGKFTANADRGLSTGKEYFVRAYLRAGNKLVLGNVLSFKSLGAKAPSIASITPSSGLALDTIEIRGKYFSNHERNVLVKFDDEISKVVSASDSLISVQVPPYLGVEQSTVSVTVSGNIGVAAEKFNLLPPEILSVSKLIVAPSDTIIVTGINFARDIQQLKIFLNDEPCVIKSKTETSIKVAVPFFRPPGSEVTLKVVSSNISAVYEKQLTYLKPVVTSMETDGEITFGDVITLKGSNIFQGVVLKLAGDEIEPSALQENYIEFIIPETLETSNPLLQVSFGQDVIDFEAGISLDGPLISEINPTAATFNELIVITGKNFHPLPAQNQVMIAGLGAQVTAVTPTTLTVKVPANIGDCYRNSSCNNVYVRVLGQDDFGNGFFTLRMPVVESAELQTGANGFTLMVRGKYFNPNNTDFNESVIDARSVKPTVANSEMLIFDAGTLIGSNLLSVKKDITVQVGFSNIFPLTIDFAGAFTKKTSFPGDYNRTSAVTAVSGNKAYVGLGHSPNSSTVFSDFYEYDPASDTWTKLPDFPGGKRKYPVSFVFGNLVYVGMGLLSSSASAAVDMWTFNVDTRIWQRIDDFPGTPRYQSFSFVAGTTAYVGGGSVTPMGATLELWTFDGSSWQQKNDIPDYNGAAKSFVRDAETAYVFFDKLLYEYNTSTDTWSHVHNLPSTSQSNWYSGGMINDNGYLWSFVSSGAKMLVYSPATNSWTEKPTPVTLYGPASFIIDNKMYAVFGLSRATYFGTVQNPDMWEFDYTRYP